ncbi:spore germination protein KC, partial [Bacillus sp. SS-TM]
MFTRKVKLLSILCASSVLSGCWDQEPLREARLAY